MNKEELIAHLKKKGFHDSIIDAFGKVKREDFLPEHLVLYAYEDISLPIDEGHTISQPSTIAFMLELLNLKENQKILEIGSGSGYVLAILSEISLGAEVYGIEIKTKVASQSKLRLEKYSDTHVIIKDGAQGLEQKAPFDRILISAASPDIATIYNLLDQLKEDGILVAPVKDSIFQIRKVNNQIEKIEFPGFSFVPLVKKE